jgi:ATP-binding cassette subfamily F protein 3
MQNLIQVSGGAKAYGIQSLFTDAVFSINEGEHVGVIGPNGAGKSTMFKILINEDHLDSGEIVRSRQLSLGYLSQHDQWAEDDTGNSFLERVSKLPLWQVKARGEELKIPIDIYEKRILSLSGGYRMRLKLLGLLGQDPNLLLLDEPTNYLDLETTLVLENFLQNYEGAFLLISHDREFLRRTTDHILEIESGEVTKYNGNIDDYFEQKELIRSQLEAAAKNQADKRKTILDFVARFGAKATKAKQAQSKLKNLEKMEVIELKALPVSAVIKIPEPPHAGRTVIKLQQASFGYPEKTVIQNVDVEIRRGEHVAVVGLNGAGKSTFLKGLAGTLAPFSGTRELGYEVKLAIFNQHVIEVLDPKDSVLDSLTAAAHPDILSQEILNMAGALLFSGDHVYKKISVLSGGEKSRVALGRILLQKVSCLLLDEPTNHLDFQTVEALIQALNQFSGTFIVVSHDRGFIRRVATKIVEVSQGAVLAYPGTYDEYVWSLQRRLAVEDVSEEKNAKKQEVVKTTNSYAQKKEIEKQIRILDKKIEACELKIKKLDLQNSETNQLIVSGATNAAELGQQMAATYQEIQATENDWMQLVEERDRLQTNS